MKFSNRMSNVPENADIFDSQEFNPSNGSSMPFSIQVGGAAGADMNGGNYTVLGSNISGNVADMVPVTDEVGNSGQRPLTAPFVAKEFAFKWIGIQYSHLADVGAGTLTFYYNQVVRRVNLV